MPGKWACCGDSHTGASHAKHTDDVRVYRASSDKIAPGAIPATWTLANRLEIAPMCTGLQECAGVWLALGACCPRLPVTGIRVRPEDMLLILLLLDLNKEVGKLVPTPEAEKPHAVTPFDWFQNSTWPLPVCIADIQLYMADNWTLCCWHCRQLNSIWLTICRLCITVAVKTAYHWTEI